MTSQLVSIFQTITSVLLILSILLQQRGSGLSSSLGGDSNVYRKKRGFEKILFVSTIVLAVLFIGSSLANLLF